MIRGAVIAGLATILLSGCGKETPEEAATESKYEYIVVNTLTVADTVYFENNGNWYIRTPNGALPTDQPPSEDGTKGTDAVMSIDGHPLTVLEMAQIKDGVVEIITPPQ